MLEFVGGMVATALVTRSVFYLGLAVGVSAFVVFSKGKTVYKLISKSKNKNKNKRES